MEERYQSERVDDALLEACRAGERDARERLYRLTCTRVFRLMVRMVGEQDAADLTQGTYLRVFDKIAQFEGHANFETWLYRLACNEALQYLRKGRRLPLEALAWDPESHGTNEVKRTDDRELLDLAMAGLEPESRLIFVLREVEGLSYQQISMSMDIPEGTVASRLNRSRRELRQQLTDLGVEF